MKIKECYKNSFSKVRITFAIPQNIAYRIFEIPLQKRSKEISSILEGEFSRREFLQNLKKMKRSKPIIPQDYEFSSVNERNFNKDIFKN